MRVDIGYSVLTNHNYELLPDFVAPRDTTELLDKRKEKFAEDKRRFQITPIVSHIFLVGQRPKYLEDYK